VNISAATGGSGLGNFERCVCWGQSGGRGSCTDLTVKEAKSVIKSNPGVAARNGKHKGGEKTKPKKGMSAGGEACEEAGENCTLQTFKIVEKKDGSFGPLTSSNKIM